MIRGGGIELQHFLSFHVESNGTFLVDLFFLGKKWFARRKAITPTFHFKILEQFVDIFDKQSFIFAEVLAKNKATDPVDIYPLVTLAALDVICGLWIIFLIKC